jgi:hypothetical protein
MPFLSVTTKWVFSEEAPPSLVVVTAITFYTQAFFASILLFIEARLLVIVALRELFHYYLLQPMGAGVKLAGKGLVLKLESLDLFGHALHLSFWSLGSGSRQRGLEAGGFTLVYIRGFRNKSFELYLLPLLVGRAL